MPEDEAAVTEKALAEMSVERTPVPTNAEITVEAA